MRAGRARLSTYSASERVFLPASPARHPWTFVQANGQNRLRYAARLWLLGAVERRGDRHQEDLEVEREGPVLDVVVVPLDPVAQGGLPAEPVHLRPSGDAGLDAVAVRIALDPGAEHVDELGPLGARAHEAHLATDDVDQLRQLVEAGAAQEGAEARAAV